MDPILPTIRDCAHRICVERPIGFVNGGYHRWEDLPCPVCAFMQRLPFVRVGNGDTPRVLVPLRCLGPSPKGTFGKGCWFYTYRVEYR